MFGITRSLCSTLSYLVTHSKKGTGEVLLGVVTVWWTSIPSGEGDGVGGNTPNTSIGSWVTFPLYRGVGLLCWP